MLKSNSKITISNNRAHSNGGAIFIQTNSYVTIKESSTVTISNNLANEVGGSLLIEHSSSVIFKGIIHHSYNY